MCVLTVKSPERNKWKAERDDAREKTIARLGLGKLYLGICLGKMVAYNRIWSLLPSILIPAQLTSICPEWNRYGLGRNTWGFAGIWNQRAKLRASSTGGAVVGSPSGVLGCLASPRTWCTECCRPWD